MSRALSMVGGIDFNKAAPYQPAPANDAGARLETLRRTLQQRADSLVREIFPAARIHHNQARIGDVSGAPGESMSIELAGDRAGLWTDHATGEGGDLIELWQMSQGYGASKFMDAVGELELHLGLVSGARWDGPVSRIATERARLPKVDEPTEVGRQTYVYTSWDGSAALAQVIRLEMSDGSKSYRQRNERGEWKSPEVRPLYNLPDLACAGVVVFVEGEKCADALKAEFGIVCTTAMGGTSTLVEKTDWKPLAGRDVVLWPDNDLVGIAYMAKVETILRGLGCRVSTVIIPQGVKPKWDAFDCIVEDGNPAGCSALIGDAVGRFGGQLVVAARQSKFLVEDFDTLNPLSQGWRVKGLWPAAGLCFIAGQSMSGKSFWVLDSLAKVCQGRTVLGRKSTACGILYVASEGANGVRIRIKGLRSKVGPLGGKFAFIGQAPNLTDEVDVADIKATVADAQATMARAGHRLGMVVIDTLSASIPGADENSAKDMSPVLTALQTLAQELDLLVVVIAHTGKNEDRGMRGWSGLLANADGVIMLDGADANSVRVGTVTKVKDGESGQRFAFGLSVVQIGSDEDGDPITTCLVEEVEVPDRPKTGRTPTKAGATAGLILVAFNRIFEAKSVQIAAAGAQGARGVSIADLRAEAYEIGVGPSAPDYGECSDEASRKACKRKWQDQRKSDFDRGRDHLVSTHRMRVEAGMIWPLGS